MKDPANSLFSRTPVPGAYDPAGPLGTRRTGGGFAVLPFVSGPGPAAPATEASWAWSVRRFARAAVWLMPAYAILYGLVTMASDGGVGNDPYPADGRQLYLVGWVAAVWLGLLALLALGHVFLDTATAFDGALQSRHASKEKTHYFNAILSDHVRVFMLLKQLQAHVTIFAQPKAVFDVNAEATEKREIKGLPGAHAKITGDALERYRADCDFRFWVERGKAIKDGKPVETVYWVTNDRERDWKDRVYGNLPPKIEADFRVLFGRELPPAPVF